MAEQDSKGNFGAWLAFFGVLIGAAVTLFLGLHNHPSSTTAPVTSPQVASGAAGPGEGSTGEKPRVPVTEVADVAHTESTPGMSSCALSGIWTAVNVNQHVSWPAHFSDGTLVVQASFPNNTQGRFKYRCTVTRGGISLIGAGTEAYGQEMPISFNLFDGDYTRESVGTFKGRTADGEQLLLTLQ